MKTILLTFSLFLSGLAIAEEKTNLIIIFTDDQGYGDLRCFGGNQVLTPNIDQMAKEGARLTSFYVAAPLCTPSRAALMTGCYPKRISMDVPSSMGEDFPNTKGRRFPVFLAGDGHGLNPDEHTLAEVAQSVGYKTGMFGKWHLGDQPEFLPTRQGFEEYFGIPYSHDIHPKHKNNRIYNFPPLPLLEGEKVIELEPDANYLTRRITEKAVQYIEKNKDEPFFMYVAHPLPHGPLVASPEAKEAYQQELKDGKKANKGIYETAIYEIDWSVGEILKTLAKQGIDDNTIVLFTSDNGPASGSAKPLSGKKGNTLEGGMRMPTVIRWKGKIKAGTENDKLLTTMDILPTFAKLIGATLPEDKPIDGKDILPALTEGADSPHEYFFYSHWGKAEAVRWGNWKYRKVDGKETLIDLSKDIAEKKNLAKGNPTVVAQLKAALAKHDQEISNAQRPVGTVKNPKPLTILK